MNVAQRMLEPAAIISFSTGAFQYLGPHSLVGTAIAGGTGILLYGGSEALKQKLKPATEKVKKLQAKIDKANTPKLTRKERKVAKVQKRAARLEAKMKKKVEGMTSGIAATAENTAESGIADIVAPAPTDRHRH